MSRFCFVHASDLRLDTPFEGVGRVTPEVAEVLRDASLEAWDALIQLAIDRGAAFLLLAGNLYDGPDCGMRAQLRFLRGLERLDEHGIRTCLVYGEHDSPGGWAADGPGHRPRSIPRRRGEVKRLSARPDSGRLAEGTGYFFPRAGGVPSPSALSLPVPCLRGQVSGGKSCLSPPSRRSLRLIRRAPKMGTGSFPLAGGHACPPPEHPGGTLRLIRAEAGKR